MDLNVQLLQRSKLDLTGATVCLPMCSKSVCQRRQITDNTRGDGNQHQFIQGPHSRSKHDRPLRVKQATTFLHFHIIFKGTCNPFLNTIYLDVFVHKACRYYSVTEYFIDWLIRSFKIKQGLRSTQDI